MKWPWWTQGSGAAPLLTLSPAGDGLLGLITIGTAA
jgi:hypothetical protein